MSDSLADSTEPTADLLNGGRELGLWEQFSFGLARGAVLLLFFGLRLKGLYRFGRWFGTVEWLIDYKRRRRFARAFARVVGKDTEAGRRRRATREFFVRNRCDKLLYLILDRIPCEKARSLFAIENQSLLEEAAARGNGVYFAMSHHGSHHVVAVLLAMRGYRVAFVRDRHEGGLRRYVQSRLHDSYPELRQMRVLFADSYPRDVYRCFRNGFLVGSAMDVNRTPRPGQKTEEVTIFGEQRQFLSGPLRVALRCRTPVLQAFIVSEGGFRYRLDIVGMLVDPEQVDDEDKAVAEAMRAYTANVENRVRTSPSLISRV